MNLICLKKNGRYKPPWKAYFQKAIPGISSCFLLLFFSLEAFLQIYNDSPSNNTTKKTKKKNKKKNV